MAVAVVLCVCGIIALSTLNGNSILSNEEMVWIQSVTDAVSKKIGEAEKGPVYVSLRYRGKQVEENWSSNMSWRKGINESLINVLKQNKIKGDLYDSMEICLTYSYKEIKNKNELKRISGVHRGVRGIELSHGKYEEKWSPTKMLALNVSFEDVINQFAKSMGISSSKITSQNIRLHTFESFQCLLDVKDRGTIKVYPLFRGNQIVPITDVTRQKVASLAEGMRAWMTTQLQVDGRMVYEYWPSKNMESLSDNSIRQFMATNCLSCISKYYDTPNIWELWEKNIKYNIKKYYTEENKLGLINEGEKVKLGAVALAALAIHESPNREKYRYYEESLDKTIYYLWNSDGSFKTFYKPMARNDNQNFYPGEALLYLSTLYQETKSKELLEKLMKSFKYYKNWHLMPQNRNPAFVPWHTQAYYILWKETKSDEIKNFIYLMNDWLVKMQQWDGCCYEDIKGRFYNPDKPEYGPPHASSTGVYLEGLIDAFCLAREDNDKERMCLYRRTIVRGLRNIMQLQFADDIDMYYVTDKIKVMGAIRTDVYNNEIRVDNIQHNLMGVLKILDEFTESDYR